MDRTRLGYVLSSVVVAAVMLQNPIASAPPPTPIADAQPAGSDILSFYQPALAVAQVTRQRDLSIICQKSLPDQQGNIFVTFLAGSTKKIVLAVVSKLPLSSPSSPIGFDGNFQPGIEWMFVFDRNHDGKVDYMLWPQGVLPYVEGTPPPGFPVRTGSLVATMTRDQLALIQHYARLIFWHFADDNFEGKVSAVILDAWDPNGVFAVTGWQVIRSSHSDGVLDQCWYFTENIGEKTGECERTDQGYKTRSSDPTDITPENLAAKSVWFSTLNAAAGLCPLTGDSF